MAKTKYRRKCKAKCKNGSSCLNFATKGNYCRIHSQKKPKK